MITLEQAAGLILPALLWIYFFSFASRRGNIFGFLSKLAFANVTPDNEERIIFLTKPLFLCPPCMASIHGSLWFIAFVRPFGPELLGIPEIPLFYWPLYCVMLSGLAVILIQLEPPEAYVVEVRPPEKDVPV